MRVGVLISGNGSNLQALIDACAAPDFPAEIVTVVSNKPEAYGLERAKAAGLPSAVIAHGDYDGREAFEAALNEHLEGAQVDLICLAGFMRVLTAGFAEAWRDKIINIHPSLLPAFPGLHTHERALAAGVKFSGCTVHYVRPLLDAGPIIAQAVVPVLQSDGHDSLAARVLKAEHRLYPLALRLIAEGRVAINESVTEIAGAAENETALFNPGDGAYTPADIASGA